MIGLALAIVRVPRFSATPFGFARISVVMVMVLLMVVVVLAVLASVTWLRVCQLTIVEVSVPPAGPAPLTVMPAPTMLAVKGAPGEVRILLGGLPCAVVEPPALITVPLPVQGKPAVVGEL